jgi:hypothetical protein
VGQEIELELINRRGTMRAPWFPPDQGGGGRLVLDGFLK